MRVAVAALMLFCLCLTFVAGVAKAESPPAQPRLALVIGNQDYRHVERLHNAVADARAVAAQLRERGFLVFEGYDLDRSGMNRLFNRFEAATAEGTIAIFYYAGHGVQVGGSNILVPVDLRLEGERDLLDDGVVLAHLMDRMAAVNGNGRRTSGLNLLIVDACRDNPFRMSGRTVGVSRGLVASGSSGVMVLYAAGSNQRALDRLGDADADPNGVFTRVLLREMKVPGLTVRELVSRVRTQVAAAAASIGQDQVPAIYDEAVGDFTFTPAQPPSAASSALAGTPPSLPQPAMADREALFWQSILANPSRADYEAYLRAYPNGVFAPIARNRLASATPPLLERHPPEQEAADARDQRTALRRGLRELGYYTGRVSSEPIDEETRGATRRFQAHSGEAQTGLLAPKQQEFLERAGRRLAALVDRPDRSPAGTPAATVRGAHARYGRAWAADNPARGIRVPAEAAYWYALAARDGEARAYTQLGLLLARGQGVEADVEAAAMAWQAAAARGEAVAAFNLGALYDRGLGVPVDAAAARLWYQIASGLGNNEAAKALRRLGP